MYLLIAITQGSRYTTEIKQCKSLFTHLCSASYVMRGSRTDALCPTKRYLIPQSTWYNGLQCVHCYSREYTKEPRIDESNIFWI